MRTVEPRKVIVLGGCGHWWRETQPPGFRITDAPRVCTACKPDSPASVGPSPQGFAMVPVTYVTEWAEFEMKENRS